MSRLRSEPEKALNLGRGSRVPMTTLQLQLRARGQQRVLLQRLETRLYCKFREDLHFLNKISFSVSFT